MQLHKISNEHLFNYLCTGEQYKVDFLPYLQLKKNHKLAFSYYTKDNLGTQSFYRQVTKEELAKLAINTKLCLPMLGYAVSKYNIMSDKLTILGTYSWKKVNNNQWQELGFKEK